MKKAGIRQRSYKFADRNILRAQTIRITVMQGKSVEKVNMVGPVMSQRDSVGYCKKVFKV